MTAGRRIRKKDRETNAEKLLFRICNFDILCSITSRKKQDPKIEVRPGPMVRTPFFLCFLQMSEREDGVFPADRKVPMHMIRK